MIANTQRIWIWSTHRHFFFLEPNVRNKSCKVRLKHCPYPAGWYGVVCERFILYIFANSCMMADSTFRPLSLCSRCGARTGKAPVNHSLTSTFATVSAFLLRVGTAMMNLLNTAVITRTFSRPSDDGSEHSELHCNHLQWLRRH